MLSDELGRTADWILGFAARNEPLNRIAMASLARTLLDLSQQARQLERLPVDDMALYDDE